jgi:hypothetical protein
MFLCIKKDTEIEPVLIKDYLNLNQYLHEKATSYFCFL